MVVERLKQIWSASPWYIKALLILVAILALFAPRDLVHGILNSIERKRTDARLQELDKSDKEADQHISTDQGKLDELNAEKKKISEETGDDAVDFLNSNKLPPE